MAETTPSADGGAGGTAAALRAAAQAGAWLAAEEAAGERLDVARASIVVGVLQDALLSGKGLGDDLAVGPGGQAGRGTTPCGPRASGRLACLSLLGTEPTGEGRPGPSGQARRPESRGRRRAPQPPPHAPTPPN
jgi:hypothetical protein